MAGITTFAGGDRGAWRVVRFEPVRGDGLSSAARLDVRDDDPTGPEDAAWRLRGVPSYERYVNRAEHDRLLEVSPPLGRPEATSAALIPMALQASREALAMANLDFAPDDVESQRTIGVSLGTGGGGLAFVEEQYRTWFTLGKGSVYSITAGTHGNLSSEL